MKTYFYKRFLTWLPRFLNTFFSLKHHGGYLRLLLFLWYEGCMIQESYCCAVGIGQQTQCNRLEYLLRAVGMFLANLSFEEKAKGLWFLVGYNLIQCLMHFQIFWCISSSRNTYLPAKTFSLNRFDMNLITAKLGCKIVDEILDEAKYSDLKVPGSNPIPVSTFLTN